MKNILLTIAYDGSRFHGWQRQSSEVTVQGYLEQTFSRLFDRQIALSGTSRTDAGVHALGQRASFQADLGIPTDRLCRVMNNALCGREEGSYALSPVRILEAREVPAEFHARFDCVGKKYVYRICTAAEPDIFRRNYVYHVLQRQAGQSAGTAAQLLDLAAMKEGARQLIGEHDFKSFESAGGNPRETTVRTIFGADVKTAKELTEEEPAFARRLGAGDDELLFEISGDGFLYNMVRIITGTLVEIGLGKREPQEMARIIEAKDRQAAGHTAPPYGLYLAEVYYGDNLSGHQT